MNVNSESDIYDDPDNVLCLFCNSLMFYTNFAVSKLISPDFLCYNVHETGFK